MTRTILSVDPSTVATGLALWLVQPGQLARRSLYRWCVLVPDKRIHRTSAARSNWILLATQTWLDGLGAVPGEVACEELVGAFVHRAPELDALVRDFRKLAARWRASWTTYQPRVWRAHVGGRDKAETAGYMLRFLDWPSAPPAMDELGLNAWDAVGIGVHYISQNPLGPPEPRKKSRLPAGARPANVRRTDYRTGAG